jgi:hypothetical protein
MVRIIDQWGRMFEALDRAIDTQAEAAFAFLEALVSVPSVVGAEQAALEVFAGEAEVLGLQVERLPFENGPMAHARGGCAACGPRESWPISGAGDDARAGRHRTPA